MDDMTIKALRAPFPAHEIKWRVGATTQAKDKGIALAYIDARCVFERLDHVVGVTGWETKIYETPSGRVLCELTIDGVTKTDGAGDTGMEAEKGAISDAIKRAAVQWGIGRYLYSLPTVWCKIKPAGKSYKLAEVPDLPAWAIPEADADGPLGVYGAEARDDGEPTDDPEPRTQDDVAEESSGDERFYAACQAKVEEGIAFFETLGDSRVDATQQMGERVTDLLADGMQAAVGKAYASYYEIEDREHRKAFYRSLKATVATMIEEVDDGQL